MTMSSTLYSRTHRSIIEDLKDKTNECLSLSTTNPDDLFPNHPSVSDQFPSFQAAVIETKVNLQ